MRLVHHVRRNKSFPRSSERGPIEAICRRNRAIFRYRHFRAHPSAAPLKHAIIESDTVINGAFPRSSERGPIEAESQRMNPNMLPNFRAHPSAAPLKQQRRDSTRSVGFHFRAHPSAAPLKLHHAYDFNGLLRVFPRSSERGPIEA